MNIEIADRLQKLRKENGYSQEELADKLGISRQAVSKWERAESSPDTDNLICLAKLYNISLDELLNSDESVEDIKTRTEDVNEAKKEESILDKTKWIDQMQEMDGYIVKDDGETITLTLDDKAITYNKAQYIKKANKIKRLQDYSMAVMFSLGLVAYLLLGFLLKDGWVNYWFVLILIPVPQSIIDAIGNKSVKESLGAFTLLIAAAFCGASMMTGLWHPLWTMFLAIPVLGILASVIDRATRAIDHEKLDDLLMHKKENN